MPHLSPTTPSSLQTDKFIIELKNQSINPPANDIVIKSCYEAFLELLEGEHIRKKVEAIIKAREFTPQHFVNILFRVLQYIELYRMGENGYPNGFDSVDHWKNQLKIILENEFDLFKSLLLTKDTTTTIYQRYAGSKIILNALFSNKPLSVADLGCGGNYGLPGLIKNTPFEKIKDHTKFETASKFLSQQTTIKHALAIDKEDPYENGAKEWRYSCSFYPHEMNNQAEIIIPSNKESETVFTRFDLTSAEINPLANSIRTNFYDAVIMSTFLYQLNKENVKKVIQFAKKIVKKNGVIIIQDFARLDISDPTTIELISNWFSTKTPYRTFVMGEMTDWQVKEILQWNNGRCKEVYEGSDFELLL